MINLEIPYVAENARINRTNTGNELEKLQISQTTKAEIFDAIFNYFPKEIAFENKDLKEVIILEGILQRLGVPYRRIE
jgi:hypothetical protein